jgi:hypothetical protein
MVQSINLGGLDLPQNVIGPHFRSNIKGPRFKVIAGLSVDRGIGVGR